MSLIDRLLNTVKLDAFQSHQPGVEKLLPKRVKLSDSGVGLVVALRVSIHNCKAYYPLDFNSSGSVLMEPARGHIGNAYIMVDEKDMHRYAQLGRTRNTSYTLYGTNTFDEATSAVFLLDRPKSQASKKAILSSPAGPKTSSATAPPKAVSQLQKQATAASRGRYTPDLPLSSARPSMTRSSPAVPSSYASLQGTDLDLMSPEPEDPDLYVNDAVAPALATLMDEHIDMTMASERIDAAVVELSSGLMAARNILKDLLPLVEAVSLGKKDNFKAIAAKMNKDSNDDFINRYNALKPSFNLGRTYREAGRAMMGDTADAHRVFTHDKSLQLPPSGLERYQGDSRGQDPLYWFHFLKPTINQTIVEPEIKKEEGLEDDPGNLMD